MYSGLRGIIPSSYCELPQDVGYRERTDQEMCYDSRASQSDIKSNLLTYTTYKIFVLSITHVSKKSSLWTIYICFK